MRVLIINAGSSSLKVAVFQIDDPASEPVCIVNAELSGIGSPAASFELRFAASSDPSPSLTTVSAGNIRDAVAVVLHQLSQIPKLQIDAVGYRVVHPGPTLRGHVQITPAVLQSLKDATVFAPLHDPAAIKTINAGMKRYPDVPHFACFDTVFHQTIPTEASIYAIPATYRDEGVHRYGFHGLSCESIVRQMNKTGSPMPRRVAIVHLGSGCSITALLDGKSVDTTMGLTPTGGVVMGTRPGDLDPGVILYLLRRQNGALQDAVSEVEQILNHNSGMVAISNLPNNVKELRLAAAKGNSNAILALQVFTRRVKQAIGAFCWLLGGLDAIVFAGGIGEHDPATRSEVLSGLDGLGVIIDTDRNRAPSHPMEDIAHHESRTRVLVIQAQEDLMIAIHVARMMQTNPSLIPSS